MGMKNVLSDTSEQVTNTLKHLALKVHETHLSSDELAPVKFVGTRNLRGVSKHSDAQRPSLSAVMPFQMFALDGYEVNLEQKARAGRVGVVTTSAPQVNFGLAFTHNKEKGRTVEGIQLGTANGSVTASTETDSLF